MKLVKKIIKKKKFTPLMAAGLVVRALGAGGALLLLGGGALGFYLGAEAIKRRWNMAP